MGLKKWYVLHVYSQHEDKVKESIQKIAINNGMQEDIGEPYVPKKKIYETDDKGKTRERLKTLAPGYIYVNLNLTEEVWHLIKGIDGVTGFLGERPIPLRKGQIEQLRETLEGDNKKETISSWKIGDLVIIKKGTFENFEGTITAVTDNKVKVEIVFFDRPTNVELDFADIEKY